MSLSVNLYEKDIKNLNIDSSLNAKLIQNENKLQAILNYTKKKKECYSTDKNVNNREINNNKNKKNKIKIPKKKLFKNYKTDFFDYNDYENKKYFSPKSMISIDYDYDSDYKSFKIIKVNQNIKIKKDKKNNLNKHSTIDISRKSPNKIIYNYKEKSKPKIKSKKNNNTNHTSKSYNTINYEEKKNRYCSPNTKSVNIEEMMLRFQNDQNRKKEWIEKQRKKKEDDEKKLCTDIPKTNRNKKINLKIKDDFLSRQKLLNEQKKKKEEKLKKFLNKKKEEEINKNNILLQKKAKRKNRGKSMDDKNKKNNDKKLAINNAINKLYEWDLNRKEKINQKRKKNNEKIDKIKHIPHINKRSSSMAELKKKKYSIKNIFDRLSRNDKETLEKKRLLIELLTPTFQPNIYTKSRYQKKDEDKKSENNDLDENNSKNRNIETLSIATLSTPYLNDKEIQKLYHNAIFQNKKKPIKSKSIDKYE